MGASGSSQRKGGRERGAHADVRSPLRRARSSANGAGTGYNRTEKKGERNHPEYAAGQTLVPVALLIREATQKDARSGPRSPICTCGRWDFPKLSLLQLELLPRLA